MEIVKRIPILKIGVKNHNGRVYTANNVQEIINNFEERKENEYPIFGELLFNYNGVNNSNINTSNVSHTVEKIYIQDDKVYADVNFLDTQNGKIALSMLECGTGVLRTRTFGTMQDKFVTIDKLITLDVIEKEVDSFKGIL